MRRLMFPAWCALLGGALVGLHLVASGELTVPWRPASWPGWVDEVGAATAIAAVLRAVALALTWYLVAATLIGAAAATGEGRVAVAARAALPRVVRALVLSAHGVVVSSAGLAVVAVPVMAGTDVAASATAGAGADAGVDMAVSDGTAALRRIRSPGPPVSEPATAPGSSGVPDGVAAEPPQRGADGTAELRVVELEWARFDPTVFQVAPTEASAADTWVVGAGDHFWSIAAEVVAEASSTVPSDAHVDAYWRTLIAANRDRLVAPGNPDLILPGQTLVLPPVPGG